MAYWAEIRNDYFQTAGNFSPDEGDILASVSIDAWKTEDDNEEGRVIACVLLSKHGDILVDYHDNVARGNEMAQEAISEAKEQLREYFMEQQKEATKGTSIPLGGAAFVSWERIDPVVNKWAKSYFGPHVNAEGHRDETDFEISLSGLRREDYEKYCRLFELYDTNKDYEPDDEASIEGYDVILPAEMAMRLMYEVMEQSGLSSFGSALATYDGVFFMEQRRYTLELSNKSANKTAESVPVGSWAELKAKYPMDRSEMSEEEEVAFVNDCFRLYEKEGFSPKYWSPFMDEAERVGQAVEIVGRIEADTAHDLSVLPMWKARLAGAEFEVFPEEVIPSEMKANGCRWFEDVLEYDSSNSERLANLPVDVCGPQECADLFGKAVRDGNRFYLPSDNHYLPKEPSVNVDAILRNAAAQAKQADSDEHRLDSLSEKGPEIEA